MQPDLLFLVHRIPYPPNKGDKIRSFHILEYLSQHYRVHLGTFVDDESDWQYVPQVKKYCASSCFTRLKPKISKVKSLAGLVTGRALTVPYYSSAKMNQWVRRVVGTQAIGRILVFSSAMAQFVTGRDYANARRLIDFVDVDSDKWRQYAQRSRWPLSWVYRREAVKLLAYETQVAGIFDVSLFVSAAEVDVFKELSGLQKEAITYMRNGVDIAYHSPKGSYENPFPKDKKSLVFVGAMDYWANVDAVCWFAREVFPFIRSEHADASFYIVGIRPAEQVRRLAGLPGVVVTGAVSDVRPYVRHAAAVVAPLRIARGIQNKVLEAMAMARPVVATAQALEGIDAEPGKEVLLANDVAGFVQQVGKILDGGQADICNAAREKVCADFSWSVNLPRIGQLMEDQVERSERRAVAGSG